MIDRGKLADLLKGPDQRVLGDLPRLLPELSQSEIFDLLDLVEDTDFFRDRLPLRLKLYAVLANHAVQNDLRLIALLRLLRRLGARQDTPDLGDIPGQTADFTSYLADKALELAGDEYLAEAIGSLARATLAFRSGDLTAMQSETERGLKALERMDHWSDPSDTMDLSQLVLSETGHELTYIAANAVYRAGDVAKAREIVDNWSAIIEKWENVLGTLPRQRYQYYRLVGRLNQEVGTYEPALEAYTKALDYAPTPYRKAFIWLSQAQIERELNRRDESWSHAVMAIDATLNSPYPQTASTWIEWLALEADTPEKESEIEKLRLRLKGLGGEEINRVARAMKELYRVLGTLHTTSDPVGIVPVLDNLIVELEKAGTWPNLVTILATKAVVAGRLNDRELMDESIDRARSLVNEKLDDDSRPPAEFLLESAHALALRDVGAYDEAFSTLFEDALEARMKYPGAIGPDEKSALEAIYYLGALAGHDPETIEQKIRDTISSIG